MKRTMVYSLLPPDPRTEVLPLLDAAEAVELAFSALHRAGDYPYRLGSFTSAAYQLDCAAAMANLRVSINRARLMASQAADAKKWMDS